MKMTEKTRGPFVPQIIAIIILLWALNPDNPYGYYILLRIVLCAVCAYLAFHAIEIGAVAWVWTLGITAVIYNPIIRIHLTREIWSVVNIATIIMLAISFATLRKRSVAENKNNGDQEYER